VNDQDKDPREGDESVFELLIEERRMLEGNVSGHRPADPHRAPLLVETIEPARQIIDSASGRLYWLLLSHMNRKLLRKGLERGEELCRTLLVEQTLAHSLQQRPGKLKSGSNTRAVDDQHERRLRLVRSGPAPQQKHPFRLGATHKKDTEIDPRPAKALRHGARPCRHTAAQVVARGLCPLPKIL
jgi:hypothetical protein